MTCAGASTWLISAVWGYDCKWYRVVWQAINDITINSPAMTQFYFHLTAKKRLVLLTVALLMGFSSFGQKGKITLQGQLFSPQEGRGVSYGTVTIFNKEDVRLDGTLCDSMGSFTFTKLPEGELLIVCNAMGYLTERRAIQIDRANGSKIDLDTINMQIDQVAIDAVRIKGDKPFVALRPNRKEIRLSPEDLSSGRELTELLARLPDFDGAIGETLTLRGKPFTLLINGHPAGIPPEALNSLNMSDITSIEVITTPMANYRASKNGGIVNIIMKRPSLGINGVVQANAGLNQNYRLSAAGNIRIKKVNIFAGLLGYLDHGKSSSSAITYTKSGTLLKSVYQNSKERGMSISPKVGFDYYPSEQDVVTLFYSGNIQGWRDRRAVVDEENRLPKKKEESSVFLESNIQMHSVNSSYSHEFAREGTTLNAALSFNSYGIPNLINELKRDTINRREFGRDAGQKMIVTNINYQMPLIATLALSTGLAGDFSWASRESGLQNRGSSSQEWQYLPGTHTKYATTVSTIGAYSMLNYFIGRVNINAGVRYEFYRSQVSPVLGAMESPIAKLFHNVFGSGGISYSPIEDLSFSLSYSGRIDRPEPLFYIPTKLKSDFQNEYFVGNPDLQPGYLHQLEFNYSQYMGPLYASADISWTHTKNEVINSYTQDVLTGDYIRKPINLKSSSELYMNASISGDVTPWCWLQLYGRVTRSDAKPYEDQKGTRIDGAWSYRVGGEAYFHYKNIAYFSVWGYYSSGGRGVFRSFAPEAHLNAIISWNINKQWRVFLKGVDLLASAFRYRTQGENEYTDWRFYYNRRTLYLGVYYRFGKKFKSASGEDVYTRTLSTSRDR